MRIIQVIIGVLMSAIAIAVTAWALLETAFPHKHPIMAIGLGLYGCIITPLFILLGESIIEDGVKLVMMFGIGAALWHFHSWQVALPFFVPPICGMLANQIIKALAIKKESVNQVLNHPIDPGR
jgi:hypothetical protein